MMEKSKADPNFDKNLPQSLEFIVTQAMVNKFADLTGDFNSLHLDKAFGRRSGYRENIVHGMLPLLFIAAWPVSGLGEKRYTLQKISARFLKPVFAGDLLRLKAKTITKGKKAELDEIEFVLEHVEAGSVLTTGYATLSPAEDQPPIELAPPDSSTEGQSMVTDPLTERELHFKDISKGDVGTFSFRLTTAHINALFTILCEGVSSFRQLNKTQWLERFEPANLLSVSLASTFVGMVIPGKHATFTDFQLTFERPLLWNTDYIFNGRVRFASPSAATVAENISIHIPEDSAKLYASGKINAKVNDPPLDMPSIEFLKQYGVDLQLKDKAVLITGASRGIGETTAKLFSLHGARVAVNYFRGHNDAQRIVDEIVSNGGQALAVQADVSDREQVRQMVNTVCAEYGTVDVLVNNAVGDFGEVGFLELTWDKLERDINIVIKGAFNCCQSVLPLMIEQGGGKVINISTVTTEVPPPNQAKYVIAKSGLIGLTRSLAVEFARYNIQVNMVSPSLVETDLTKNISKMFLEGIKHNTPMQRNASPVDVAKAVVMLASSMASFTTGQKFMVTGGQAPFL